MQRAFELVSRCTNRNQTSQTKTAMGVADNNYIVSKASLGTTEAFSGHHHRREERAKVAFPNAGVISEKLNHLRVQIWKMPPPLAAMAVRVMVMAGHYPWFIGDWKCAGRWCVFPPKTRIFKNVRTIRKSLFLNASLNIRWIFSLEPIAPTFHIHLQYLIFIWRLLVSIFDVRTLICAVKSRFMLSHTYYIHTHRVWFRLRLVVILFFFFLINCHAIIYGRP